VIQKVGEPRNNTDNKSEDYAMGGDCNMANTSHYSKNKIFLEEIQG
jgi:hypothetical protein